MTARIAVVSCHRSYMHVLYFVVDRQHFTFNASDPAFRVPSARQRDGDARGHPNGRIPDNTWILRPSDAAGLFDPCGDT